MRKPKSRIRGEEIQDWLKKTETQIKVNSFVILDDDSDMAELMEHLVHQSAYNGLTMVDAMKAITYLMCPYPIQSIAMAQWEAGYWRSYPSMKNPHLPKFKYLYEAWARGKADKKKWVDKKHGK